MDPGRLQKVFAGKRSLRSVEKRNQQRILAFGQRDRDSVGISEAAVAPIQATYGVALAAGFYIVAAFFCAEYVLRLIAAPAAPIGEHCGPLRARLLWVASLGGVFDLISALPGIVAIVQGPSVGLFGFVWAFKYVRYSPGLAAIGRVVSNARQALLSVLLGFAIVLLTASSVAYLLERDTNPDAFGSIPAALWWGIVTMTTTGYGDVVPQTVGGRVLGGVLMIGGILVFALWAGILAQSDYETGCPIVDWSSSRARMAWVRDSNSWVSRMEALR